MLAKVSANQSCFVENYSMRWFIRLILFRGLRVTLISFLFRLRTSRQAFLLLQKWLTPKLKMSWRTTWWRSTSWHHVIITISSSCLTRFTMRANCGWVDLVYFSCSQILFLFSFPQHNFGIWLKKKILFDPSCLIMLICLIIHPSLGV